MSWTTGGVGLLIAGAAVAGVAPLAWWWQSGSEQDRPQPTSLPSQVWIAGTPDDAGSPATAPPTPPDASTAPGADPSRAAAAGGGAGATAAPTASPSPTTTVTPTVTPTATPSATPSATPTAGASAAAGSTAPSPTTTGGAAGTPSTPGAGGGAAGEPTVLSVSGNLRGTPLWPGRTIGMDLVVENPGGRAVLLSRIDVSLSKITPRTSGHGTGPGACTGRDFATSPLELARGVTVPAGTQWRLSRLGVAARDRPTLTMRNRPVNQDACQGVALTLHYRATAREATA